MKLRSHKLVTSGARSTLSGQFFDNLRRPANIKIVIERGDSVVPSETVVTGETGDVMGTLFALAEVAWANNWRPRGLGQVVANTVINYKEPPEQR